MKDVNQAPGVAGAAGVTSKGLLGSCFPIIGDSEEDSTSSETFLNRTMLCRGIPLTQVAAYQFEVHLEFFLGSW